MSESSAARSLSARHYQAVCGVALAAVFLVQMRQNVHWTVNLLMLFIGSVSILARIRMSPLLVFVVIAAGQVVEQYNSNQFFNPDFRPFRLFTVADLVLCMAILTYLVGLYRLHGLWFNVLPDDPRERPATVAGTKDASPPPQARSEKSMTSDELTWLVFVLPPFALAAEFAILLLRQNYALAGLPSRWRQFLTITWLFLAGTFVAAQFFRYWRRAQMDRATAQLLLQDVLWNETRGEQRRINRWIAWRKLKRQEEADYTARGSVRSFHLAAELVPRDQTASIPVAQNKFRGSMVPFRPRAE